MPIPINIDGLVGDVSAVTGNSSDAGQQTDIDLDSISKGEGLVSENNAIANAPVGTGSSVAANSDVVGGTNVADTATSIINDPSGFLGDDRTLSDDVTAIDPNTPGTTLEGSDYTINPAGLNQQTNTVSTTSTASNPVQGATSTYDTKTTKAAVDSALNLANAEQGTLSSGSIVNVDTLDMKGLATGVNSDGTVNQVGQSLNTVYTQNMSRIVDTTTLSGKMLAQELGEGNYIDAKSTVAGQLEILQSQFTDPVTGEPRIPAFAAGAVKGVMKMMALSGVTGTAALGAVSAATMESILPIANADSKFFQTLTIKNLDARNTQALNTANILSKMNVADLDARMTQAVSNAKNFMMMDLENLGNKQQTHVLKMQFRQQSIMEDGKQENVRRQFVAESQNEMDMFYDELGSQVSRFNATQANAMKQFNSGEINDMSQFNASLENNREQFYQNMQYKVDAGNAQWRQDITVLESEQKFEAAAIDVKNMVGLTSEQLNNMWDRTDSLLDYAWREGENARDRMLRIFEAKLGYDIQKYQIGKEYKAAKVNGVLGAIGTGIGVMAALSDVRLKENIVHVKDLANGVGIYQWDWNEKAKSIGAENNPTIGVIAQEVMKIKPEAVQKGKDGYLRVNYNEVFPK